MTIAGWISLIIIAFIGAMIALAVIVNLDLEKPGIIITIIITAASIFCAGVGIHWYLNNTARGSRALKTQQSELGGGLDRTVTVYSYDGQVLGRWSGQFDVTEDDQETYFDIKGKRVIIQGGIVINEEN